MTAERRTFDPGYIAAAAHVLGILSHETRLNIVLLLAQAEATVSDLCAQLGLPQSNVSHHLRILRDTALVSDRRDGQFVIYRLNIPAWRDVADGFFDKLLEGEDSVTLQKFMIQRRPEQ